MHPQGGVGGAAQPVTLARLGADGEQTDPRVAEAGRDVGVTDAEGRVLHQVDRVDLHSGADIEQDERSIHSRQDGGQRRAPYPEHATKADDRGRHRRPTGTGGDDSGHATGREREHRRPDRGLRIRAMGDRVGHSDAALHGVHRHAGPVGVGERGDDLVGDPAGADKQQLEIGFGSTRLQSAVNHDGGGVVPAEEVDGDPLGAGCLVQPTRCGWRHPGPKGSDLEDLTTVVRPADGAHGVRQLRRPALRAGDGRHRGRLPLRPARPGVAARHSALRYGHDFSLDQAGGDLQRAMVGGTGSVRCAVCWSFGEALQSRPPRVHLLVAVVGG